MRTPYTVWRQHCLPQHALTKLAGKLSHSKQRWLKDKLIRILLRDYPVNLAEALESDPTQYASFHDFFTRQLKPGCRPIDDLSNGIVSPCDGAISEMGKIKDDTLIQAKNHTYRVADLLADAKDAAAFRNGHFMTVYLAPQDYHRVHMPIAGEIEKLRYVPGKLFSVNPLTAEHIPNLFARNERVITFFRSQHGSFAIILVGAMIVGSIHTQWGETNKPHKGKRVITKEYSKSSNSNLLIDKGDEMGYFALGSTVILLFAQDLAWEYDLNQQSRIVVGQRIGHFLP